MSRRSDEPHLRQKPRAAVATFLLHLTAGFECPRHATNGVLVALTSLYPNLKAEAEAAVPNRQIVTITALAQLRAMRRADFARLLIRAAKRRKKPRGRKMPTHIARGSATRGRVRSRVELRSALDRSPATFAANAPLFFAERVILGESGGNDKG
jgi:hypothetical protein